MSFRGRGGGRGRAGPPRAKQMPFDIFSEIPIGVVKYSVEEVKKYSQFVSWSQNLQTFFETSPYHYQDRRLTLPKMQKVDIERYSDKKLQATTVKQPLHHLIMMDRDHMPGELVRGGPHTVKRVKWDNEIDLSKLDQFEKLEEKNKDAEENEEEEVEEEGNEEDGEISDDGDYGQNQDFDDDEDDYNMAKENDEDIY
ncbi:DNA-directed RNA polymerase III subunit RPC7-like [Salvia splendens]|uniref:DNA-directed RNA polymerase III subunit RPC7-like n=1 Tax=Salvia splendens TaxID=180675 RepID=UPI001C251D6F|nr:DNA-directed RNA polymerase III subunit RPC7-like [Salvia splendens]